MKLNLFKILLIFALCFSQSVLASQVLPKDIIRHTETIYAQSTGEVGKTYFYCQNGNKCSTEQVVKEYYKNKGYSVMRAEHAFWRAMFTLSFFEEIFSVNMYKQAYPNDIPFDMSRGSFYACRKQGIDNKYELIKKSNLKEFINSQITKHESFKTRLLYDVEIEGYPNTVEYFKSSIVQDFLDRIDMHVFTTVIYRIAQYPGGNTRGTPDYIVWNKKELIFVEVKRDKEKLREDQITWAEFLIDNKIPYKVVRVISK